MHWKMVCDDLFKVILFLFLVIVIALSILFSGQGRGNLLLT